MKNAIVNSISKIFDTALAEIVEVNRQILAQANAERVEMLDLVARMQETRETINELGKVYTEVAEELTSMADDHLDISAKIADAIDEPAMLCPSLPYEELAGWCDECGEEISVNEDVYGDGAGDEVCETCHNALAATAVDD